MVAEDVARALASFVRTLRSGGSAFDRFRNGERDALPDDARRGLTLFTGRAGCSSCHAGPNLTDGDFHNTGIATSSSDPGRFGLTRDPADVGAFRTPSLRDVAVTAPYMHDGSISTLEEVIDFYDGVGVRIRIWTHVCGLCGSQKPKDARWSSSSDLYPACLRCLLTDKETAVHRASGKGGARAAVREKRSREETDFDRRKRLQGETLASIRSFQG